jgi:orotate phosphoribosyltransferase
LTAVTEAPPMIDEKILTLFKEKNALLQGHFLLSSGLHSDHYFQSALVLQAPQIAGELGKALAQKFQGLSINAVISPALGGLIIGHEVARAIGCRAVFSEKNDEGKPVLRRGFNIDSSDKVLVIEDVITTGLSTGEVVSLVQKAGAHLAGIGSLVNRTGNENFAIWGTPVHSLLNLTVKSWPANNCELCQKNIPAVKPGSRKQ